VRAMGLTLSGPDEFCNCCETKDNKDKNGLRGKAAFSTDWLQQGTMGGESPPTPKPPAAVVKSKSPPGGITSSSPHQDEVTPPSSRGEKLVGTYINDNFALPQPAAQDATMAKPNRSLFQSHVWDLQEELVSPSSLSGSLSSSLSSINSYSEESSSGEGSSDEDPHPSSDEDSDEDIAELLRRHRHSPPQYRAVQPYGSAAQSNMSKGPKLESTFIAQHCTSSAQSVPCRKNEIVMHACLDSDSDYTTDSATHSPCLPNRAAFVKTELKKQARRGNNWATLGQSGGSVLDHLRSENNRFAKCEMMKEYIYWSEGENC